MTATLRVFVSSAQKELADERLIVQNLVSTDPYLSAHCIPVLYELGPASPHKALEDCLEALDGCQVYLLIVGVQYGTAVGDLSITHAEYRRAKEKKLPVLAFIKGERHVKREEGTAALLAELYADGPKYKRFGNVIELQMEVRAALLELLKYPRTQFPSLTIKALLEPGGRTKEGRLVQEVAVGETGGVLVGGGRTNEGMLVQAVAVPWFEIQELFSHDPEAIYNIDPRTWEEIIAGAYTEAGFDEVILTPRSGDKGRDIVATKYGIGSIRIFDQVKAYRPGHVVTAEEVRAMLGVITGAQNVSKGIITTTSTFAPRIMNDDYIRPLVPYRLELKPRDVLLDWLDELRAQRRDRKGSM